MTLHTKVNKMDDYTQQIKTELARIAADVTRGLGSNRTQLEQLQARLLDVEQHQPHVLGGGGYGVSYGLGAQDDLAAIVAADEGFQLVASGRTRDTKITLPANSINRPRAAALTTTPGLVQPDRQSGFVLPNLRRLTIRDLMLTTTTDSGSIEYLRETSFANGAAIVSEGSLKPESSVVLTPQVAAVVTIASWTSASEQILADLPALKMYLDGRLRHGLGLAEENQLLNGSGVAANMLGLTVGGTAYAAPFTYATPTKLDQLRLCIDVLELANFSATGIVLHPNDLTAIELLKDTTGAYIKSDPAAANHRTAWGVPIVCTSAQVAGKFTIADFGVCGVIYDRAAPTLEVGRANDDFLRNMVRLRLESRVSMALLLPSAIVSGTFT